MGDSSIDQSFSDIRIDRRLISLVKCRPVLYNRNHRHCNSVRRRIKGWEEIALQLEMDLETAGNRWDNLRKKFVQAYQYEKYKEYPSQPELVLTARDFRYYEKMLWYAPHIEVCEYVDYTDDSFFKPGQVKPFSTPANLPQPILLQQFQINNIVDHNFIVSVAEDCQTMTWDQKMGFKQEVLALFQMYKMYNSYK